MVNRKANITILTILILYTILILKTLEIYISFLFSAYIIGIKLDVVCWFLNMYKSNMCKTDSIKNKIELHGSNISVSNWN